MYNFLSVCFACLETSNSQLLEVYSNDTDNIPFIDKLRSCVSADLDEENIKRLCLTCAEKLQNAFAFQQMILLSQEALGKRKVVKNSEITENVFESFTSVKQCMDVVNNTIELPSSEYSCTVFKQELELSQNEDNHCNNFIIEEVSETIQEDQGVEYSCPFCTLIFDGHWRLQKHIRTIHDGYKKFHCTYCTKSFKQSYHLREHLTSHTGEKKYVCEFCSKPFHRLSSMHRHTRSHERAPGEKTKKTPFLCSICGKSFPFSNGVQRHMRVHTGIRNHKCHVCSRQFSQSTHLQVHMRTHTGEKPYICETCGVAYSLNASLLKHMKVHIKSDS